VVVAVALLAAAQPAAAGEPQVVTAAAIPAPPPVPPHRFLDTTNALLSGLEAAALIGDAVSTRWGLDRYPGFTREANPIARPFVERGWPGQIAGGLLFVGAELWGRHTLHKAGHHRLERLLPIGLAAMEGVVVIHNVRGIHSLDRMLDGRR
jgi:hypothetical protein